MSNRTRSIAIFAALLALGAMPVSARAQAYPNRPITLVIPLPHAASARTQPATHTVQARRNVDIVRSPRGASGDDARGAGSGW